MHKKQFLLFSLLSTYILVFAHSVIPHHHHENKHEADSHHQHEHTAHQHDGGQSEGHGHTAHFIHTPEFGTYLASTSFKLAKPQFHVGLILFVPATINFPVQSFVTEVNWFPDLPPPYKNYTSLPNGLRGSPTSISLA